MVPPTLADDFAKYVAPSSMLSVLLR